MPRAVKDPLTWMYPHVEPHRTGRLGVGNGHEIHWEECGNPKGKPVVFVHGGPGGGTSPRQRRFFDPERYRIVLFDQRGCGRSTPHASLEHNTTWDLVADIERLRELLGIARWQVFGGSWGSTLALAYAQKHPDRVTELVLRGIFLLRRAELLWFYQGGASAIYPEYWAPYRDHIPAAERDDLMAAYHRRLVSEDAQVRVEAARRWYTWESMTSYLVPPDPLRPGPDLDAAALAMSRIECHYFVNKGWFDAEDQLLRDVGRIRHIPGVIVQGRYDVVCPITSAWDLHEAWPEADFVVSPDAGHSAHEPANTRALVAATDRFAERA